MKRGTRLLLAVVMVVSVIGLALIGCAEATPVAPERVAWVSANFQVALPGTSDYEIQTWFKNELFERSNGRFILDHHWGDMGANKEMLGLASSGAVDVANIAIGAYPGELPLHQGPFLPFIAPPRIDWQALSLRYVYDMNEGLRQELEDLNVVKGWYMGVDKYNLFSHVPIRTVEDLKGLKVRCGAAETGALMEALGATPMFLPSSECYNAMQTGLIDAYVHLRDSFWKRNIFEVAEYYIYDMDIGAPMGVKVINKDSWDALPDDLKEVWRSVEADVPAVNRWVYLGEGKADAQEADFKAAGMEFIQFPSAERNKLIEVARTVVWEDWVQRVGEDVGRQLIEDLWAAAERAMAEYPDGMPPYVA